MAEITCRSFAGGCKNDNQRSLKQPLQICRSSPCNRQFFHVTLTVLEVTVVAVTMLVLDVREVVNVRPGQSRKSVSLTGHAVAVVPKPNPHLASRSAAPAEQRPSQRKSTQASTMRPVWHSRILVAQHGRIIIQRCPERCRRTRCLHRRKS